VIDEADFVVVVAVFEDGWGALVGGMGDSVEDVLGHFEGCHDGQSISRGTIQLLKLWNLYVRRHGVWRCQMEMEAEAKAVAD
jgi:hypothetical protein